MYFSLHQGAIVMCMLHFNSLPQPHHVTASYPSSCDKPPENGRVVRKGTINKKPNQLLMQEGSPVLYLSRSLHRHPTAAQGHRHTIHPT